MAISQAVGTERVSRVVGYEVQKGNFQESTPNLPMRIAIFGQANTANQPADDSPVEVTSEVEAGQIFGFGSMIHQMMRIIRARTGDRIGGIPTIIYPQLEPTGAAAQVDDLTITGGPATAAAVHIVRINGRSNFDGASLEIAIAVGDTVTDVAQKIADAINNAQNAPVSASNAAGVVTITTKWQGESAAELDIEVDTQSNPVGLTYGVTEDTAAAGDSSAEITASLAKFGNDWNTIVVTGYPQSRNALFEAVNGTPADGANPATGRYQGIVFKPFVLLSGNNLADTVANVTANLDPDQVTVCQCPAPNSNGWTFEAAANVCAILGRQAQDNPHLDAAGAFYPDMPVPLDGDAGIYTEYNGRDSIIKNGGSTVIISNGRYKIEDLATSYHPVGEIPPQFRYVRSLIQDWNVRFAYFLLEQIYVVDHTIVGDDQPVNVARTVKPKQWRAVLTQMFQDLTLRAIIVEPTFSVESLQVSPSTTNPDRLETFFRYKRSPFARIASTTAEAGFSFGEAA